MTEAQPQQPQPTIGHEFESRPIRLLLIGDDAGESLRLATLLSKTHGAGFVIETVHELESAVPVLAAGDHDAVLLDIGGPTPDGLEAVARVSPAALGIPVVVLASAIDEELRRTVCRLGASDLLARPADGSELLSRVVRFAVERRHLLQQLQFVREREHFLATRDPVTGLPNRCQLQDHLNECLAFANRTGTQVGVLVLSIDRFKKINDNLGHAMGDLLLRKIGVRLIEALRRSDFRARLGGDEFAVVLPKVEHELSPGKAAERILASLAPPHILGGHEYWVTASIGISVFPRDGTSGDVLLRQAETAMHKAKEAGRNGYRFYDSPMNESALQKLALERRLRKAFADGALEVYYQPKVDVHSGLIVGSEALLRWFDPELGQIPTPEFIGVAQECGLIGALCDWTLRKATVQTREWQREGFPSLSIAVNVWANQVKANVLRERVVQALWESGLKPGSLELEITEHVLMQPEGVDVLQEIKRIGIGVSLDDFGTGFSSLSHLKSVPVDTVKIDRSFVSDLLSDPDDAAIVAAILSIAKNLDLTVVAEGVETQPQLDFLTTNGCHQMQGFLASPAVSPDEFLALLRRGPILAQS